MTMLEKAARAAAKADATLHNGPDLYEKNPELYLRLTRAVLMAVREPDLRAVHFGSDALMADNATMADAFTAMIDAILNEGAKTNG